MFFENILDQIQLKKYLILKLKLKKNLESIIFYFITFFFSFYFFNFIF